MRVSALTSLLLAATLGSGCTLNAAFELEIGLPPGPTAGPTMWALLQPRNAAENPFPDVWRGDDLDPIELIPSMPQTDRISILSSREDVDLALKVRFCISQTCTELADDEAPERWIEFEHPFYIGARTSWKPPMDSPEITVIPPPRMMMETLPILDIPRCSIRGCVDGELSSYCRTDGRHLCE